MQYPSPNEDEERYPSREQEDLVAHPFVPLLLSLLFALLWSLVIRHVNSVANSDESRMNSAGTFLIQRSAWNSNSRNFRFTEFSEVAPALLTLHT